MFTLREQLPRFESSSPEKGIDLSIYVVNGPEPIRSHQRSLFLFGTQASMKKNVFCFLTIENYNLLSLESHHQLEVKKNYR